MKVQANWVAAQTTLRQAIDFHAEYNALGCTNDGTADTKGWVPCLSHPTFGGVDGTPSAGYRADTGQYHDFRKGLSCSFFDLLALLGLYPSWFAARDAMAKKYNVTIPTSRAKQEGNQLPEAKLIPKAWDPAIAQLFCTRRKPITLDALRLSGASYGLLRDESVLYWPIRNAALEVTGFYTLPALTLTFTSQPDKKAEVVKQKGEVNGLLGDVARLQAPREDAPPWVVFWFEGMTDLLAAYTTPLYEADKSIFLTNPNGCSERISTEQLKIVEGKPIVEVTFCADADWPGVIGAWEKAKFLRAHGLRTIVLRPAGEVAKKHGRDVRDVASEEPWAGLVSSDEAEGEEVGVVAEAEAAKDRAAAVVARQAAGDRLMAHLGITYAGLDDLGKHSDRLFCARTNRFTDTNLTTMNHMAYALVLGRPFLAAVAHQRERDAQKISFEDFQDMVSGFVADQKVANRRVLKSGIWRLSANRLFLVGGGEWGVFENGTLTATSPIYQNICGQVHYSTNWLDVKELSICIEKMKDPPHRAEVFYRAVERFSSWTWEFETAGELVAALVYATWLQDLWDWRPLVFIDGPTAAGKSSLFRTINALMGFFTVEIANPSAAGVFQTIEGTRRGLLVDEVDQMKDQNTLMSVLRLATQGQQSARGTAHQTAKSYDIHHLAWLSGIYSKCAARADLNRQIRLSLSAPTQRWMDLRVEDPAAQLEGDMMLASALVVAQEAHLMAAALQAATTACGEPARVREAFILPAAMTAAVLGKDLTWAAGYVGNKAAIFGAPMDLAASPHDHDDLLDCILSTTMDFRNDLLQRQTTLREDLVRLLVGGVEEGLVRDAMTTWERVGVFLFRRGDDWQVGLNTKRLVVEGGLLSKTEWFKNFGLGRLLGRAKMLHPYPHTIRRGPQTLTLMAFAAKMLIENDEEIF